MTSVLPFDPNAYRKRVLAEVAQRGGPDSSDAFELYDLPLDGAEDLGDATTLTRIDEVWGFWQRQRDHPKYRTLVAQLVDEHDRRSAPLRTATGRRDEAVRVRAARKQRDAGRYEILDTAISRLVERYGGVPAEKVAGLEQVGALGGLTSEEVTDRLRRHRVLPAPASAAPSGLTAQRRAQIDALLTEWSGLRDEPTPTLFALLGLGLSDAHDAVEIRQRADILYGRARELPAGRLRAVLDELVVHVREVLAVGGPLADAYVRAVRDDVTEALRPKVRAAILIEDRLIGPDYEYLAEEGVRLGLPRSDSEQLLADLAAEYGGGVGHAAPTPPPMAARPAPVPSSGGRGWEAPLKAARAALRRGRPTEAARLVAQARDLDDGTAGTQVRTVADEARRVLDEAAGLWRDVAAARAERRFADAARLLAQLNRRAVDAPVPPGQPDLRTAIDEAQRGLAGDAPVPLPAAPSRAAPVPAPPQAPPPPGPTSVTARWSDGAVLIAWTAVPGATYKVSRQQPDGTWKVVGRTRATELEDGGAPRRAVPMYAVVAVVDGVASAEMRSTATAPPPAAAPAPAPVPAPAPPAGGFPPVTNVAVTGGRLTFDWPLGITEVYIAARADAPPRSAADPAARTWKVTNTRYQIDGGAPIPADLPQPCHLGIAACRRGPDGAIIIAPEFAPTAHVRLD